MRLDPAVAAVRLAVRRELADVHDQPVLVACSGGADSLALLAATVFEARRPSWHVVGVTVDHGLQPGSADQAAAVVRTMGKLGVAETASARVQVSGGGQGPEAAAREARYAVLAEMAAHWRAGVVLLGHTLDDQAETVLLGLTRGSGGRALAGMRRRFEVYRRPLLDVTRAQTEAACVAAGVEFWTDPHNADPRYTRSRVRHHVLPVLEAELGPGVTESLARTADQLREDAEALDELADLAAVQVRGARGGLDARQLEELPTAVRRRVLRRAAVDAGSPPAELFRSHVLALDELVTSWHGQRFVDLPGHVRGARVEGELLLRRTPPDPSARPSSGPDPVGG
jgi:tRNA(Ile)-lysidine synthase